METRVCGCGKGFSILEKEVAFYEQVGAGLPKRCPECRVRHRLAFWPFGRFHRRVCDLTGERIISIYSSTVRFPVYKASAWRSDAWVAPSLDLDLSRPFFEQFYELQSRTPRPHQFGTQNVNCDYTDDIWSSRDCYLCRSGIYNEHLAYSYRVIRCRDSFDLCYCYDAEQSYDCVFCFKVYRVQHAFDVRDSYESAFLYDCRNVRNCFMCYNLRNQEYCIFNQAYSKEAYFEKIKEYRLGSYEAISKLLSEFWALVAREAVHKTDFNVKSVASSGNYLTECKNVHDSYFLERVEDSAFLFRGLDQKSAYDCTGVWEGELVLNSVQVQGSYNVRHSNYSSGCRDSEYLDFCEDCHDCFGCVGLRKKSFCILNKQYSEEEYAFFYERIRANMQMAGVYGDFFPLHMATTGYNLSLGQVYFSLRETEVREWGGLWEEVENGQVTVELYAPSCDISEVGDDVIFKALKCDVSGRLFNITRDELAFYRTYGIPLPRRYPEERTIERLRRLPAFYSREAMCAFCSAQITVHYPLEWGYEKVACASCYHDRVS